MNVTWTCNCCFFFFPLHFFHFLRFIPLILLTRLTCVCCNWNSSGNNWRGKNRIEGSRRWKEREQEKNCEKNESYRRERKGREWRKVDYHEANRLFFYFSFCLLLLREDRLEIWLFGSERERERREITGREQSKAGKEEKWRIINGWREDDETWNVMWGEKRGGKKSIFWLQKEMKRG